MAGIVLITAEKVLAASRESGKLHIPQGRVQLTDEARDLAARLGVELIQNEAHPGVPISDGRASRVQLVLGSDHGGYELKERLKVVARNAGYSIHDVGCKSPEAVDYPDYAAEVARMVSKGDASRGLMIDTIGIASAMACNKIPGCRAAACESIKSVLSSRRHNNANVLTLGAALHSNEQAAEFLLAWLREPYDGGRHQKRVDKIMALEKWHHRS